MTTGALDRCCSRVMRCSMKLLHTTCLLATAAVPAAAEPARVTIEKSSNSSFTLTMQTKDAASDAPRLQRELEATAIRICDGQPHFFGRHTFESNRQVTGKRAATATVSLTFRQEVSCGAEIKTADTPVFPPVFDAQKGDDRSIVTATNAYFSARDSGRYAEVFAMLTAGMRDGQTQPTWSDRLAAFNANAGRAVAHRVIRVTWYDSPGGAAPGLYAAADFDSDYQKLAVHCGYVIWFKEPGSDGFGLMREEQGFLTKEQASKMSAADKAQMRSALQCRD